MTRRPTRRPTTRPQARSTPRCWLTAPGVTESRRASSGATIIAATVLVWTLGEILTASVSGAIIADLAPPHLRGRYSGFYGTAFSIAALLGPLVGSRLLSQA